MSELEIGEVFRKTFSARSVRVTEENLEAVAEWCGGTVKVFRKPEGYGRRIDFLAHGFKGISNINRAYVGDWIVFATATSDFKAYPDKQYRSIFETRAEKVLRENLTEPEIAARNEQIFQLVMKAMRKQDVATYHGEGTAGMRDIADETVEEVCKLFV